MTAYHERLVAGHYAPDAAEPKKRRSRRETPPEPTPEPEPETDTETADQ